MKKKETWSLPRHKRVQKFVRPFAKTFLKQKENFIPEHFDLPEGACLVLCNHVSTFDPFMLGLCLDIPMYYVLSDDIVSKKFIGPLLDYLIKPIPKTKSVSDIRCVRSIMKVISENHKVMLFPEGNRTYSGELCHVDKSIAKLCKMAKCPVVIFNIKGAFGAEPRFGATFRKGEVRPILRKILTADEVKEMSNEDLYNLLIQEMTLENRDILKPIKAKDRAEYLERCLYYCPDCHKFETIYSHDTDVYCLNCGYQLHYNEDLTFTKIKGNTEIKNVAEWYQLQTEAIETIVPSEFESEIYSDYPIKLFNVIKFKKRITLIRKGRLSLTKDSIIVTSGRKTITIPLSTVSNACVLGRNKMNFFVSDYIYQFKGNIRFSALKYVQMFHHIKNVNKGTNGKGEFLGM